MATKAQTTNHEIRNTIHEPRATRGVYTELAEVSVLYKTTPFMQNKPNFRKAKMKLSFYSTKGYENKPRPRTQGKQTQSNPISKGAMTILNIAASSVANKTLSVKSVVNIISFLCVLCGQILSKTTKNSLDFYKLYGIIPPMFARRQTQPASRRTI